MLDLQSSRWAELCHAYGGAADIPALLHQLQTAPPQDSYKAEPWYSICSALCHQGDVYTATNAAMPHIVEIARKMDERGRFDCMNFVCHAEACRHRKGAPPIPSDLNGDYLAAIDSARELFLACLRMNWNEEETKVLLGGLAVTKGYAKLGKVIIELDSSMTCLACGADLSSSSF
jgi:hypothetical protein